METIPTELIYQILNYMKYSDISALCQTCLKYYYICYDIQYWSTRLDIDFQVCINNILYTPSEYIIQYKHPNLFGIKNYRRWHHTIYDIFNLQTMYNNVLPKWYIMHSYNHEYNNTNKLKDVIKNEHNDILFWLIESNQYTVNFSIIIHYAIRYGNIEILDYIERNNIMLDTRCVNLMIQITNHTHYGLDLVHIYEYLKIFKYKIIDALQWFELRNIYPNTYDADLYAKYGCFEILEWLFSKNIMVSGTGANLAAENGYLDILILMGQYGIYPSKYGANRAIINHHYNIYHWLIQYGIYPDDMYIDKPT